MLLLEQFENLTLHPKNAVKLKELVLQLAVQGKLTETWRKKNPDVVPASELLKRIQAEKEQLVKEKKLKNDNFLKPFSEINIPFELPLPWEWCRFSDLLSLEKYSMKRGPFGSALRKDYFVENGYKVYEQANAIYDDAKRGRYYITEEKFQELKAFKVSPKDLIVSCSGTIGRIAEIPENAKEGIINQALLKIKLHEELISNSFFILLFRSKYMQENILDKATGSAIQNMVGVSEIKNILIPLPPFSEQEAIVARVEELMHKIEELEQQTKERIQLKKDLGTAALQQVTSSANKDLEQHWDFLKQHFRTLFDEEENLKKLRETILQLAVQGKLTSSWRKHNPKTEPAAELLKRIQAEKAQLVKEKKFKKEKPLEPISWDEVPYQLPEGWIWCRLNDVALKITDGFHNTPPKVETGYPYILSTHVKPDKIDWENCFYVDERYHRELHSKSQPEKGDLLVVNIGAGCGIPAIIDIDFEFSFKNSAIIKRSNYLLSNYLFFFFLSIKEKITEEITQGGAQPYLSLKMIKYILFPLPPLTEQETIVVKVNELMQLCNTLEQEIKHSKQDTQALMQAVVREDLKVKEEVELQ